MARRHLKGNSATWGEVIAPVATFYTLAWFGLEVMTTEAVIRANTLAGDISHIFNQIGHAIPLEMDDPLRLVVAAAPAAIYTGVYTGAIPKAWETAKTAAGALRDSVRDYIRDKRGYINLEERLGPYTSSASPRQ